MRTNSAILMQALQAALASADPARLNELQTTLKEYRSTNPRMADFISTTPFVAGMIEAIDSGIADGQSRTEV